MARYKALRSLHYLQDNGEEKTVAPGEFVVNASAGKIADLLRDGFVEEVKASSKDKDG